MITNPTFGSPETSMKPTFKPITITIPAEIVEAAARLDFDECNKWMDLDDPAYISALGYSIAEQYGDYLEANGYPPRKNHKVLLSSLEGLSVSVNACSHKEAKEIAQKTIGTHLQSLFTPVLQES